MDYKSVDTTKSNVVLVNSPTKSNDPEPQPKIAKPIIRGNRTAFRRIQMAHSSLEVVNSVLDMSWCRLPLLQTEEQRQPPKRLKHLRFLCSDEQVVSVTSFLLFRYTEELRSFREEDLPIKLPAIHSTTLLRAIRWMRLHKLEESAGCCCATDGRWEEELLEGSGDLCELMDLIMTAIHLGLNVLARHAAEYMEERIAQKTQFEMRLMKRINSSLTLDKEEYRSNLKQMDESIVVECL